MRVALAGILVLLVASEASAVPAAGAGGMAATAHPDATDAALEMLRQGGNATDAAVAAAFALAVVEPYFSGLGGGGFALIHQGEETKFLDFREIAPQAARPNMFVKAGKPQPALSANGPLSVAVPASVAGYLTLLDKYGTLPRAKVMEPAIHLAERGFFVDERYRAVAAYRLDALRADPEASKIFLVPGDGGGPPQVPPPGTRIVQADLANTLRAIARGGARGFYGGTVGQKLVADMAARGGLITSADLDRYAPIWRQPLVGTYLGHAVATAPLPSSGGVILLTILNALEAVRPGAPFNDVDELHLYIEASKRAFADRALLGDPAFVKDPTEVLVKKGRVLGIGPSATASAEVPAGAGTPLATTAKPAGKEGEHTTHLCVIDVAGNAVSMTTTINAGFGSGVVARGTGVLWNDEMDDFAIAAGVPNVYGIVGSTRNQIAPGKRPLSSMAPTMVFEGPRANGSLRLIIGSPGGSRIPTILAQAIVHQLFQGAEVDRAIDLGRVHHQHLPDVVYVEPFTLDASTKALLTAKGHHLEEQPVWGNATAIALDPVTALRRGAADARGVGTAAAQ